VLTTTHDEHPAGIINIVVPIGGRSDLHNSPQLSNPVNCAQTDIDQVVLFPSEGINRMT
jgi:hypothetical protein